MLFSMLRLKSLIEASRNIRMTSAPSHTENKILACQGKLLSDVNRKKSVIDGLSCAEFSVFSQWGEDGILDWLISQLPHLPKVFVEFGVENYHESNTRLLAVNDNWRGLIIDGSLENIDNIKSQDIYWRHDISAVHAFITASNIEDLIMLNDIPENIGVLSIDIDGNDYWVWKAIQCVRPCIVVCEYNAVLGDLYPITVPYREDFCRTRAHHSNLYFGASISALYELGLSKGYAFLGTNSNGVNAFFIRNDLAPYLTGKIGNPWSYPSQFRESRDHEGKCTYIRGDQRSQVINHLPIHDLSTNKEFLLRDLGSLYSDCWSQQMPSCPPFKQP